MSSEMIESFPCNLVDPASCDVLVLKIKPCMPKYKLGRVKLRIAHYNAYIFLDCQSTG